MNQLDTDNNQEINIILCPKCRKTIPMIYLVQNFSEIFLEIKCECTKTVMIAPLDKYLEMLWYYNDKDEFYCSTTDHTHFQAHKYCPICQLWLCQNCLVTHNKLYSYHILRNRQFNLLCSKHKKKMKSYCNDCNKSICIDCRENHQTHAIAHVSKSKNKQNIQLFQKDRERIDNIMNQNKVYKKSFNEWIDAMVKQLGIWKKKVDSFYQNNKKNNQQLKQLCEILRKNANLLGDYSIYSFSAIISTIKIAQNVKLYINNKDIKQSYQNFSKHYFYNFVIELKQANLKYKVCNFDLKRCSREVQQADCLGPAIQIPDKKIVSLQDNKLIAFDHHSLQLMTIIREKTINCFIQLQDGRLAVAKKQMIQFWETKTFKCLNLIILSEDCSILFLIQLLDERLVFQRSNKLQIWDISTYQCIESISIDYKSINSFCQLQNGNLVLNDYAEIVFYNCSSLTISNSYRPGCNNLKILIQLQDQRLVCGFDSNKMMFWDIITNRRITRISTGCYDIDLLQLKDGRLVSSGQVQIEIWDVVTFNCILSFKSFEYEYENSHFHLLELEDDYLLVLSSLPATLQILKTYHNKCYIINNNLK